MPQRHLTAILPLCVCLSAAACVTDELEPIPEMPEQEPPSSAVGRFELTSSLDLSQALPASINDAIAILGDLSEDAGGTLFALIDDADIPVVDQLLAAMPPDLRADLITKINEFVASQTFQGVPVAQVIGQWANNLEVAMREVHIVSVFDVARTDDMGNTDAIHTMSAIGVTWNGSYHLIDTPDLVDQLTIARDVAVGLSGSGSSASVNIGAHGFNMPMGDFLLPGLNAAIESWTGEPDIPSALSAVINCPKLGESVSGEYALEVELVCENAIVWAASKVEDKIAEFEYAELHFQAGNALLTGGSSAEFQRVDQGVWEAFADLNGRELPIGATFVGQRLD